MINEAQIDDLKIFFSGKNFKKTLHCGIERYIFFVRWTKELKAKIRKKKIREEVNQLPKVYLFACLMDNMQACVNKYARNKRDDL